MSGLLAFHRMAAARGDGLHPKLLELLEHRERAIESNPNVIEITDRRDGAFVQSGPVPQPAAPQFLPGNVVGFRPNAATAKAVRKTSSL